MGDGGAHIGMRQHLGWRRIDRQTSRKLAAGCNIRKDQETDIGGIMTGKNQILDRRRHRRDRLHAQRAGMHPGTGTQFEFLRHATGEFDAARQVVLVSEAHGVADPVITFRIERGACEVVALPVPGSDIRALDPNFEFPFAFRLADRDQLERGTRRRIADHSGLVYVEVHASRHRRGFSRAPRRNHAHAMAGFCHTERFQPRP